MSEQDQGPIEACHENIRRFRQLLESPLSEHERRSTERSLREERAKLIQLVTQTCTSIDFQDRPATKQPGAPTRSKTG